MLVEVFTKPLEDLLLATAIAEGNADQKDVMNLLKLNAVKEECFAMDPALPLLNGGFSLSVSFSSRHCFHCIIISLNMG